MESNIDSLDGLGDNDEIDDNYEEDNDDYRKRRKQLFIIRALRRDDTLALQQAAAGKWGLLTDEIRRKVWPKLAGISVYETSPKPIKEEVESHPYYNQVVMDVNRSLKRFPPSIAEKQRLAMQDQLVALIMRILVKHPELHYYQGYHDICVTFLLVLGEELSFIILEKLSTGHLRVFMDETMDRTSEILGYIYILIKKENMVLRDFLEKSDVGVMFGLSWLITWFGHVLNKYDEVARLFDLFLVSHSWMPMYVTAAIVLYRQEEILKQDCDMASVHCLLSNIPNNLPVEHIVTVSQLLFHNYPPKELLKHRDEMRQLKCILDITERKKRSSNRIKQTRAFLNSMCKTFNFCKNAIPSSKWSLSIVIATAVLFCAAFYQAYRG